MQVQTEILSSKITNNTREREGERGRERGRKSEGEREGGERQREDSNNLH